MTKHNEATNETRAAAAFAAFTAYGKAKERHPEMSVGTERLTDLLCDLRHMAMRDHLDFGDCDRLAKESFEYEIVDVICGASGCRSRVCGGGGDSTYTKGDAHGTAHRITL